MLHGRIKSFPPYNLSLLRLSEVPKEEEVSSCASCTRTNIDNGYYFWS